MKGSNLDVHENKKFTNPAKILMDTNPKIKPVNFLNRVFELVCLFKPFNPNFITSKWTI